jgi:hypothetical protein
MAHARSLRRLGPEAAGVAAFLLLVASVPSWIVYETWADRIETAALWSVAGPDCPEVTPTPQLFGAKGPYTFSYGGTQFSRRFGHVSCAAPQGGGLIPGEVYHVCQFNGPAALAVATPEGVTYFKPGVGRPATVTIRGGKTSCVVGGWFRA